MNMVVRLALPVFLLPLFAHAQLTEADVVALHPFEIGKYDSDSALAARSFTEDDSIMFARRENFKAAMLEFIMNPETYGLPLDSLRNYVSIMTAEDGSF